MKSHLLKLILLIFLIKIFVSCKKDKGTADRAQQPSVMEYLSNNTSTNFFYAALLRAKADTFFSQGGPFTVFAPNNDAFIRAGFTMDKINTTDPEELSRIITFNILPGRLGSSELVGFLRSFPVALNAERRPNITKNYYGVFYNGARAISSTIPLGDGVVYTVDDFAIPQEDSMLTVLEAQPDLTYFTAIVNKCYGLKKYLLKDTLTVIAPNDNAFRQFGFASVEDALQQDTVALMRLVVPYILRANEGLLYSSDFIGGREVASESISYPAPIGTIPFGRYKIAHDGKTIIPFDPDRPTGIFNNPQLIKTNILTRRGIIHVVDQVFVP